MPQYRSKTTSSPERPAYSRAFFVEAGHLVGVHLIERGTGDLELQIPAGHLNAVVNGSFTRKRDVILGEVVNVAFFHFQNHAFQCVLFRHFVDGVVHGVDDVLGVGKLLSGDGEHHHDFTGASQAFTVTSRSFAVLLCFCGF